ncbi:MAG: SulP family inorganic anion transporter [Phycisphaeraceae bacterium]|nr:SulP family inorganic anion transporter [Phycisphaeraceae bacterium]
MRHSLTDLLRKPFEPVLTTARHYRGSKLKADLLAGITVAAVEMPQAMAYAYIAQVPPQYGLYTSIVQGILGAIFSSNNHLASGPTNTQSLLVAATAARLMGHGDGATYLQIVIALTLLKGLIQLAFAAARLGNLVRYVSESVIIGFTAGAGILIAVGQVRGFLGMPNTEHVLSPGLMDVIAQTLYHLDQIDSRAVLLGVTALAVLLASTWIWRLFPGPLVALATSAAVVYFAGWTGDGVRVIGALPSPGDELLHPTLPLLSIAQIEALAPGALALALLGMIETVAIGKSIASRRGERINANQEFFTQGLANTVGSFFGNIPGSGSFTRSALNAAAGGQTRLTGVINSLTVLVVFIFFRDAARYIPQAGLAAILFVVAYGLVDWRAMARIARTSRTDAVVCLTSLASALLLPLQYAIYVGVLLNIGLYVRRASELHIAEMVRTGTGPFVERPIADRRGGQKVIFLQVEGDLFFGVADELEDQLQHLSQQGVRVIILRMKRTHWIDTTVLRVLERFAQRMQDIGGQVILCGVKPELMQVIASFGLDQTLGRQNIFETGFGIFTSAKRALQRARELVGESLDLDDVDFSDDESEGWGFQI